MKCQSLGNMLRHLTIMKELRLEEDLLYKYGC